VDGGIQAGNHAVVLDASNLPGGIYLSWLDTPQLRRATGSRLNRGD
jgi:hypothetical protein